MESVQRMWCRLQIKFMHFTGNSEVANEDYKRQRTESGPLAHTAAKCFPGEKELTDPNTLATVWQIKSEPFKQTVRALGYTSWVYWKQYYDWQCRRPFSSRWIRYERNLSCQVFSSIYAKLQIMRALWICPDNSQTGFDPRLDRISQSFTMPSRTLALRVSFRVTSHSKSSEPT